MNKLATLLATTAALALAAPSFAMGDKTGVKSETSVDTDSDGGYTKESSTERTNAAGTKAAVDTKVDLDVGSNGDATKTVTTKETVDPKGLFNKNTVKTETKEELDNGTLTVEHEKKVNGKVVVDTEASY